MLYGYTHPQVCLPRGRVSTPRVLVSVLCPAGFRGHEGQSDVNDPWGIAGLRVRPWWNTCAGDAPLKMSDGRFTISSSAALQPTPLSMHILMIHSNLLAALSAKPLSGELLEEGHSLVMPLSSSHSLKPARKDGL